MNIYTKKPVISGINIVPMLDILTILLIFFIVQTEFKRQVNVLEIDVPRTQSLSGEMGNRDQVLLEIAPDGAWLSADDIAANRAYNVFKEKHKDDYKFI